MEKIPDEVKEKAIAYKDNPIYKNDDHYDAVLYGYSLASKALSDANKEIERLKAEVAAMFEDEDVTVTDMIIWMKKFAGIN